MICGRCGTDIYAGQLAHEVEPSQFVERWRYEDRQANHCHARLSDCVEGLGYKQEEEHRTTWAHKEDEKDYAKMRRQHYRVLGWMFAVAVGLAILMSVIL